MAFNPNVPAVAPGDLITSTHINNIRANLDRLDTSKLSLAGGAVTGNLYVAGTLQGNTMRVTRAGSPRPFIEFYAADNVTRQAALVGADTGVELTDDTATAIRFIAGTAELARFDGTRLMVGKAATNLLAAGLEVESGAAAAKGSVRTTIGTASVNVYANHVGAADAAGCNFAQFVRAGTVIGSISQVATTGVAYNTTSDERLKRLTRPVDPDESVAKVSAMDPVNFVWTAAPGDGEQVGFFAQALATVAPEAVTPGQGEPGDDGFVPWMVDVSKLVPTLVAAVQSLTRRIEQLEGAPT